MFIGRPLSGASEVMQEALANLDSAVALASAPSSAPGFPLDSRWINARTMSAADFARFVRSYRARFRAGVARTPTQRAAVDWAAVIGDVENGIQADVNVTLDPSLGWANGWIEVHYRFNDVHQMTPMIIGKADTSGDHGAWLSLPLDNRAPSLSKMPDRRFPSGETREAQIAYLAATGYVNVATATALWFRATAAGAGSAATVIATGTAPVGDPGMPSLDPIPGSAIAGRVLNGVPLSTIVARRAGASGHGVPGAGDDRRARRAGAQSSIVMTGIQGAVVRDDVLEDINVFRALIRRPLRRKGMVVNFPIDGILTECDPFGIPSTSHWMAAAIIV